MVHSSLLDADYSEKELQAAQEAAKRSSDKLHQKAWKFFKKVCPFGK